MVPAQPIVDWLDQRGSRPVQGSALACQTNQPEAHHTITSNDVVVPPGAVVELGQPFLKVARAPSRSSSCERGAWRSTSRIDHHLLRHPALIDRFWDYVASMGFTNPKGRNWGPLVNWDGLGKTYAGFTIAWTIILYSGVAWLLYHRRLPFLKIRNIPLAIAAVSFLHVYLIKILLAYTVNGNFPCNAEFWIMSIYLPFGVALFQANLLQLQSVSAQQKKFLSGQPFSNQADGSTVPRGIRRLWARWCGMTVIKRTEVLIGVGMLAQVIVTAVIFGVSKKVQTSWPQVPTPEKGQGICRKGWEWIPSAIWQLVWTWFFGPWILYKIKDIKDVHYWRLQTILCIVAGLPGAPLWLASLYSKKFKPVNKYWVPPMWLAPGIIMMQFVTIFFPIVLAYRSRAQRNSTLRTIKSWEDRRLLGSLSSDSAKESEAHSSSKTSISSRRSEMYTMAALEKALATNPLPLLRFAASREFSGENIIFLMLLRDWHTTWSRPLVQHYDTLTSRTKSQFNIAVQIFRQTIHAKTAQFPINIESKIYRQLDALFGSLAVDPKTQPDEDVVDPFNHSSPNSPQFSSPLTSFTETMNRDIVTPRLSSSPYDRTDSEDTIVGTSHQLKLNVLSSVTELVTVPAGFDEHVFDEAERSIKFLVLTNTWPKFVDSCSELNGSIGAREP